MGRRDQFFASRASTSIPLPQLTAETPSSFGRKAGCIHAGPAGAANKGVRDAGQEVGLLNEDMQSPTQGCHCIGRGRADQAG